MSPIFWLVIALILAWILYRIWSRIKTPILQGIHNFRFPKDMGCHQWRFIKDSGSYLCNHCHKKIPGGFINGSYCIICEMYCHNICSRRLADKCKYVHFDHIQQKNDQHQWIEGNLPLETVCSVCHTTCVNPEHPAEGMRCVWCQRAVHKGCTGKLPEECDCGQLRTMVLRPEEVHYEKIYTNMAQFKRKIGSVVKKSIDRVKRLRKKPNNANEEQLVNEKWSFNYDESKVPVIVCVNSKSGGQKGEEVLRSFYNYLNPLQVVDLINEGIESLNKFKELPRWKVIVAGGDGTVAWVLNYIYDTLKPRYYPEIGLVPLGTGNDLSRVLGWGKTIADTDMHEFLLTFEAQSTFTLLDRWKITFSYRKEENIWKGLKRHPTVKTTNETKYMYNYFGLGLDAKITKDFHNLREQYPSLFTNRLVNKFFYGHVGSRELIMGACRNLQEKVRLFCDDKEVELPYLEGLTIINITSQAGGVDYWGNHLVGSARSDNFSRQGICDQTIEAIGLTNVLHMGRCMIGLDGGIRLCQGKSLRLLVDPKQKVPVQIDGEPFTHQEGTVTMNIELDTQVRMMKRIVSSATAIEKKCYQVIDWAKQSGHISSDQAQIIENELAKKFNN